jgi:spore germination protein YaaH
MVTVKVDLSYVKWAHENGKKVWPLFGNRFDPVLTNALVSNPVKRQQVIATIKNTLISYDIDGINVDFENIDIKNKADFVAFVREMSEALRPAGKTVTVDLTRTNPDPNWSGSYDRMALGQAADSVILMGYDEHWIGNPTAGSVASLPWTDEGIRLLMNEVPAHKIILGVPFYTREWVTDPVTGKVTSIDRTMTETEKLIADKNLQITWDGNARQNYVEFLGPNGEKHQIWLEDKQSMELRRNLVNQYRLLGIAAWYVGSETPDIWPVFDPYR